VRGVDQVFLMLTSGGEPLQLTNDQGDKFVDSFSPDGNQVYYGANFGRGTWAVPTLGGTPRRVASAAFVIGSHAHAPWGIMCANWHHQELQRLEMGNLFFTTDEQRTIYRHLRHLR
jgi:hypothetical protein